MKNIFTILTLSVLASCANEAEKVAAETQVSEPKIEIAPAKKKIGAFLEISLNISEANRADAVQIYKKYKQPFLTKITGARSKALLVRADDVQVLHGFDSVENANAYLKTTLFSDDVVVALKPLLETPPDVRIFQTIPSAEVDSQAGAFLEINLKIDADKRERAAAVYTKYRKPFLDGIAGATSKQLNVDEAGVQVLHGFANAENAKAYLKTTLFEKDIVGELGPLLAAPPEIRIYSAF